MSVYNGERYLGEAIESILSQSFADFEFVIIDDGSTDGTAKILEQFEYSDARIRVHRNGANVGLIESLNHGLNLVSAPVVARMDADDVSHPHRLETQIDLLRQNPDLDVVGSSVRILDTDEIWLVPSAHEDILSLMCFNCPIYHPSVVIRRLLNAACSLGSDLRYDESKAHAEDYDLWVRLGLDHGAKFVNIAEPLVERRRHEGAVGIRYSAAQKGTVAQIRSAQLRRLGIDPTPEELDLHNALSAGRFTGEDCISRCADWLAKLGRANEMTCVYPREAFRRLLGDFWYRVCQQNLRTVGRSALTSYYYMSVAGDPPKGARIRLLIDYVRSKLAPLRRMLITGCKGF